MPLRIGIALTLCGRENLFDGASVQHLHFPESRVRRLPLTGTRADRCGARARSCDGRDWGESGAGRIRPLAVRNACLLSHDGSADGNRPALGAVP
jgi:hypothetical protein